MAKITKTLAIVIIIIKQSTKHFRPRSTSQWRHPSWEWGNGEEIDNWIILVINPLNSPRDVFLKIEPFWFEFGRFDNYLPALYMEKPTQLSLDSSVLRALMENFGKFSKNNRIHQILNKHEARQVILREVKLFYWTKEVCSTLDQHSILYFFY